MEYAKWVVTLPPKTVDKIGWKEGEELDAVVRDGKIVLKPKKLT